jgi:hypothetical protein
MTCDYWANGGYCAAANTRRYMNWVALHQTHTRNDPHGAQPYQTKEHPMNNSADAAACIRCSHPLWAPASQQRGICEGCWIHPDEESVQARVATMNAYRAQCAEARSTTHGATP